MPNRKYAAVFERTYVISRFEQCNRILDLGCGDGTYTPYLQMKATEVIGLDYNIEKLANLKKCTQVICADASRLPFKDHTFDIVWASEVIEHTPTLAIFSELERITRETIVVTVPNPSGPYYGRDPSHILEYSIPELQDFLKRRNWNYAINGLGLCLPCKIIPNNFRKIMLKLTWRHPKYAFNILITGYRQTEAEYKM